MWAWPEWKQRLMRRLDGDRHMRVCGKCRWYKRCVAAGMYCPPYGLASRWVFTQRLWLDYGASGGGERQKEIVQELLEYKKAGWGFTDFCEICNFKCKAKSGEKVNGMWKHCVALDIVVNEIPCPIEVKK